ncbi:MAG: Co2+/Mg2+ efflux protein ApaG [Hyphomicrobiaceae bacterium]
MYERTTEGVRVRVEPAYDAVRSDPSEHSYFWTYTIEIRNEGSATVQLLSRHWIITDAAGVTEVVRGPGVVGQTPVLDPGESFTYTSGCPLRTPSGIMVGSYRMVTEDGTAFDVEIPAFSLDQPGARVAVN